MTDHQPTTLKSQRLVRLRWRHPSWSPTSSTRSRIVQHGWAVMTVRRLRDRGFEVEVSEAVRTPWVVVEAAPFTRAER